jgi:ubiquinone/menaquinone biosynthesis C-methylase UbiE
MNEKRFLLDPKVRFSSRVENYVKYRPSYPSEILHFLTKKHILSNNSVIADVGSGTGILSELFLKNGNVVYGIEPNVDMRSAGEKYLMNYPNFISINGSAEFSPLDDDSIDLITAGQAFHWFDVSKAKDEFQRILRPNGHLVLIWNTRKKKGNPFWEAHEQFVQKYGTDYQEVRRGEKSVEGFFNCEKRVLYNFKDFNYEGFKGLILSASYIPLENNPGFVDMMQDLKNLFQQYQVNGIIRMEYDTEVFYGKLHQ